MNNKIKQNILNYFLNNKKENNIHNNIKFNNTNSNLNSINLNKNYIYVINKINQKANYFDSYRKKKQNKELIKVKTTSIWPLEGAGSEAEKLIKPLTLKLSDKASNWSNWRLNSKFKSISHIKLLSIYLKSLKDLKNTLVSYIKTNSITSIFINEKKSYFLDFPNITFGGSVKSKTILLGTKEEIKEPFKKDTPKILTLFQSNQPLADQKNSDLIKHLNLNKFAEKNNNKSNLIKIINIEKNQFKLSNQKNKSVKLFLDLEKKDNDLNLLALLPLEKEKHLMEGKENIQFNNLTFGQPKGSQEKNEYKSSILLFIKNLKKNKNKLINLNSKNNIRKYINSKTTFNSKITKFLATSNNYNFNNYNKITNPIKNNIYEFLYRSFISMFSIISKPVYIITPDKIIIQFFYLIFKKETINKNNTKSILLFENNNKLKIICNILTRFFKKPIELDLIRLSYPYFNSDILVKFIGMFINKIQLRRIVKNFISKSIKNKRHDLIPSGLSGIKIKVAGRLLTQRVIPRKTVKIITSGSFSRAKTMFIETARFTNKNKRGAFSLTVTLGHKLNNTY